MQRLILGLRGHGWNRVNVDLKLAAVQVIPAWSAVRAPTSGSRSGARRAQGW